MVVPMPVRFSQAWDLGDNFLVVNADKFDNFLGHNHEAVLVITIIRQPYVLCVEFVFFIMYSASNHWVNLLCLATDSLQLFYWCKSALWEETKEKLGYGYLNMLKPIKCFSILIGKL